MDLSPFTTQQSSNIPSANGGGDNKSDANGFDDLGLLFQKLFNGSLDSEQSIKLTQVSRDGQLAVTTDLNIQIEQIAKSLQLAIAQNNDNVVDLNGILSDLRSQLTLTINSEQSEQTALDDAVKLALINLLIGTPLKARDAENAASPFENTEATLNENMLFDKILNNINQGEALNIPLESIIAAGITPAQLQNISQQTALTLSKSTHNGELSEDLISLLGLVQSLPVQSTLQKTGFFSSSSDGGSWMLDEGLNSETLKTSGISLTPEDLKNMMKAGEITSGHAGSKAAQMVATTANQNSNNITTPVSFSNFFSSEMNWFDPASQELINTHGLPSALNGTNLTSLVTQTSGAHSAHPASQMIAVSLQKHAAGNENRNWTLHLDPPDLGKVEIRLNFSKDKMVKAQMIIEKPETWLMLQRDAHTLERALQNSGLDASQDGISFELADQGHDFNQNGSHDGQGSHRQGQDNTDELEIIETTMTWFADPDTGVQRYNLMV